MLGLSPHEGIAAPIDSVNVHGRRFVNGMTQTQAPLLH